LCIVDERLSTSARFQANSDGVEHLSQDKNNNLEDQHWQQWTLVVGPGSGSLEASAIDSYFHVLAARLTLLTAESSQC